MLTQRLLRKRTETPIFGITIALLLIAGPALACGSTFRNISRGEAFTIWGATLFLPMVLLIPMEIAILKRIGGLGSKVWAAYAWCLLAKGLGGATVAGVAMLIDWSGTISGIIGSEALYSATHFLVSLGILSIKFNVDSKNAVQTAALISTVIPWLYSLGIPATAFLMLVFYS